MTAAGEGRLVPLGPADIDRVMDLEQRAFDETMRADRATVLKRFALGHHMVGAEEDGRLVGTIAWSTMHFSLEDLSGFPTSFKAYSTQPVPTDPDAVCLYSLGIEPAARGAAWARRLINVVRDHGRQLGLRHAVADGPIPSFAGSGQVPADPAVRRTIERYLETGEMPADEDLLRDPVLALYRRLTDCRFIALLEGFLPEDTASGGWRVLLYRDLGP